MWDAPINAACLGPLREVAEVVEHEPDHQYLSEHIGEFDAYLATLHVRFDKAMAQRGKAGRLRMVCTPTTGLDHIDTYALSDCGIELRSIKTEYDLLDRITSTAELAFGLMLAVARKIPAAHHAAMGGQWARDRFRGQQLAGKTLGILGVGRLGRMMVGMGRGLGMNVVGCDPDPSRPIDDLTYLKFPEFAARCDVITIHMHLTPQTTGYLSGEKISMMKRGAILINTSRGALIDESALLAALQSGQVGGFGADVIDGEWRDDLQDHPLIQYARDHDHVVIVPHIGGITWEAQTISHGFVVQQAAEIIRAWDGGNQ